MPEEKQCFIIMPLTTPKSVLDQYENDEDHFLIRMNEYGDL